ncbi:hypothetical protein [Mesorhizobium sp. 128a]
MKRIAAMIFVVVWLALCFTGPAIFSRPMDGLSVAWFVVLALTSFAATIGAIAALILQYTHFQMRDTLDGFFWIVFLVLPISVTLCASAVWVLGWYFFGWNDLNLDVP